MSNIHFQPLSGVHPLPVIARYQPNDCSLVVGPDGAIPASMHRISIDTLTLSLRPDDHVVVGLDAYANWERWEHRALAGPIIDQEAALRCIEPFDHHGIGPTDPRPARFIYSDDNSLLRLEFGNGQIVTRIRCLSCATCGLGAHGELLEIWISLAVPL